MKEIKDFQITQNDKEGGIGGATCGISFGF